MVSKRTRFSLVARNALPLGKRKLRAKPSLTRTTSPIWPSLPTRSSRITSIVVSPSVDRWIFLGPQAGRSALACNAAANVQDDFGETEQRHRQHRPAEHDREAIDACQYDCAAAHPTCDRMQDGEAEHGERHEQAGCKCAEQHAGEIGQKGAGDRRC